MFARSCSCFSCWRLFKCAYISLTFHKISKVSSILSCKHTNRKFCMLPREKQFFPPSLSLSLSVGFLYFTFTMVIFYSILFIVMCTTVQNVVPTKEKCATENGTFLIKLFPKIQLFLILTVCLALNSFISVLFGLCTLTPRYCLFSLQTIYSRSLDGVCASVFFLFLFSFFFFHNESVVRVSVAHFLVSA